MQDTHICLAQGNGGRMMMELMDEVFAHDLVSPESDVHADAARLTIDSAEPVFTTDGFTVDLLEFPGGASVRYQFVPVLTI